MDENLAEAYAAVAYVKFIYDWDWEGAETDYKRSIALNPKYASAHQWYAEFLGATERHEEARPEIEKALELDPLSLIINAASGALYQEAGDDLLAIETQKKTLEMNPDFFPAHYFLYRSYFRKGIFDARNTRNQANNAKLPANER